VTLGLHNGRVENERPQVRRSSGHGRSQPPRR
jgi:hypothetical protein